MYTVDLYRRVRRAHVMLDNEELATVRLDQVRS